MKFIEFAFRLGVVFAIFGFIWGIFQLILTFIRGARMKTIFEEYSLKFVQYFFLVDVTFLFCIEKESDNFILLDQVFFAAFILILYFIGKLQNQQNKMNVLQFVGNKLPNKKSIYNLTAEISAIVFGISIFILFIFYPNFANNPISNWFYENILEIEKTFFFGFIFKIIGFFVLTGILLKLINGFAFLMSGKPLMSFQSQFNNSNMDEKKNDFDDFEEMN